FAVDPYSYDLNASSVLYTKGNEEDWSDSFDLISATYPIIEITNRSGHTVTGFTFTMNGSSINVVAPMADDATITINSVGMGVLVGANNDTMITGVYEPTDLLMSGVTGTFPVLEPGSNDMNIAADPVGGSFDIRITYRKRYRN